MSLILNQSQAEAVYSAMCALNNVGGQLSNVRIGDFRVVEHAAGHFVISDIHGRQESEVHDTQDAFAIAYSLNTP